MRSIVWFIGLIIAAWVMVYAWPAEARACCHYCGGYNYEPVLPDSCSTFDCHLHYAPVPYATIGPMANREVVFDQGLTVVALIVREDHETYFSRAYQTIHYTADRFFMSMTCSALIGGAIAAFFTLRRMRSDRRS